MTEDTRASEHEVERSISSILASEEEPGMSIELPIFSLSGGLMRSSITGNRIDGLLSKMLQKPDAVKYVKNVDRNLDYLITSLQLDMIKIIADESSRREDARDRGPSRMEVNRLRDLDNEG